LKTIFSTKAGIESLLGTARFMNEVLFTVLENIKLIFT